MFCNLVAHERTLCSGESNTLHEHMYLTRRKTTSNVLLTGPYSLKAFTRNYFSISWMCLYMCLVLYKVSPKWEDVRKYLKRSLVDKCHENCVIFYRKSSHQYASVNSLKGVRVLWYSDLLQWISLSSPSAH